MPLSPATARRNIRLQSLIFFTSEFLFLVPVVTLLYKYTGLGVFEIVVLANIATLSIGIFEFPTSVFSDVMGRTFSMRASLFCNPIGALATLILFNYVGFVIAAIFAGLYTSFWSGTGEAFLDENLRLLGEEKRFGKILGHQIFLGQAAKLLTPLFAAGLLYYLGDNGYRILAFLDVIVATISFVCVLQLKNVDTFTVKFSSFGHFFEEHWRTIKEALANVWHKKPLRLLLLYRSLANHVSFLPLVVLLLLVGAGMPDWMGGVIMTAAAIGGMLGSKYAYMMGERTSYAKTWVTATVVEAVLLIASSFFIGYWPLLALCFFLFNIFEGLWRPAWNHVLVEQTQGKSVATTRSIIFGIFALYTTCGKQLLAIFPVSVALLASGIFILLINIVLGRKIIKLASHA